MSNANQVYDDRFIRRHKQLFAQAKERTAKQIVEQQEIQSVPLIVSVQQKIQQQLLTVADLKSQIAAFQNVDNGSDAIITKTTSTNNITNFDNPDNPDNPDALNVVEEQYRTSLITNMIQLIQSKRKPV
jgi:3-dehydroquinate synthase class II